MFYLLLFLHLSCLSCLVSYYYILHLSRVLPASDCHASCTEIREAFDVLDNDKDGRLNAAELETLLRGQFVVASNKELKELLENMDADSE